MISVVICSVDNARFAQVEANLARSMGEEYEIIRVIDARSMCEGYNRALQHCRGDLIVYCHDDIEVATNDLGRRLRRHLEQCDLVGVAGTTRLMAAGWVVAGIPYIHGQVAYVNPNGGYDLYVYGAAARLVRGAQALDGLFFACRRQVAEGVGFDAVTFDGFHGYDVDFTFRAFLAGYRVAVACDIPLIHASAGNFDEQWQRYAEAFERKHQAKLAPFKKRLFQFAVVNVQSKAEIMEVMTAAWE